MSTRNKLTQAAFIALARGAAPIFTDYGTVLSNVGKTLNTCEEFRPEFVDTLKSLQTGLPRVLSTCRAMLAHVLQRAATYHNEQTRALRNKAAA